MPKPWERYASPGSPVGASKPWERYGGAAAPQNAPAVTPESSGIEQRIAGAFEDAAAQPETRLSTGVPGGYGITDYVRSSLPFGDEVGGLGAGIGDYLAGKSGLHDRDVGLGESIRNRTALERRYREEYEADNPGKALAGTVAGIATLGPARTAVNAVAQVPTALGGRMGQGAVAGGGVGALYGAGEGQGLEERGKNALIGGGIGAVAGAAVPALISGGTGIARAMTGRTGRTAPTSVQDLKRAKNAAYHAVDQSGIRYAAPEYDDMLQAIANDFKASGFDRGRHRNAATAALTLWNRRGRDFTLSELDKLRQIVVRDAVKGPDQAERLFGLKMVEHLDALMNSKSGGVIETARAANTVYRKAQMIEEAITKAERQAARTGSGGNIENALRQKISSILDSPQKSMSLTAEERVLMEEFVQGGGRLSARNLLRQLGKASPEGNGLIGMLQVLGAYASGGATLPIAAGGFAAKRAAEGMARRGAAEIQGMVAGGGKPQTALPLGPGYQVGRLATNEALGLGVPYLDYMGPAGLPKPVGR